MTSINRQNFLNELGKLLTFMYEEDRQTAVNMYADMFDEADDEQSLIHHLVSPTRQAVVVARSYNSRERKLQVSSTSRREYELEAEENPEYIKVINGIREEAIANQILTPRVSEDQFSLFEDDAAEEEPEAPAEEAAEAEESAEETEAAEEPAGEEVPGLFEEVPEEPAAEAELETEAEEAAEEPAEAEAAEEAAEAEAAEEPEEAGTEAEKSPAEEPEEAETAEAAEEPEKAEEQPAEEKEGFFADYESPVEEAPAEQEAPAEEPEAVEAAEELADEDVDIASIPRASVRKPRVFLLILYTIIAIPVGLAALVICLLPTLLSLGLAGITIAAGVVVLSSAFGGFVVFADIMLVVGAAIIILALGLLFLWIFIWFIGGAMVSIVRGIITLGGRWCYKEVQA